MSAAGQLHRLLSAAAPTGVTVTHDRSRPWASAMFIGERHRYTLVWAGGAPTTWLDALPDWEADLAGYVAIDAVVRLFDGHADAEFLVIDDA